MNLLQMSISGGVMILAVIVMRALTVNILPKKTFIVLWGVVLLRLLIPFSIPSVFSAYSFVKNHNTQVGIVMNNSVPIDVPIIGEALPKHGATSVSPNVLIWIIGLTACVMFFSVAYVKFIRKFRESLPVKNDFITKWLDEHKLIRPIQIRQSDRVLTPLTYGVFKPVILMPKNTNWQNTKQLKFILAHEYLHVKHFDAALKLLLATVLCVHWFNPLVLVMYILSNRDLELLCDEAVVRCFGDSTKAYYAKTLISMEENKNAGSPFCNNFSKNAIKERITAIMKIKKTSFITLVAAALLIGGLTTVFATGAQEQSTFPKATSVPNNTYEQGEKTDALVEAEKSIAEYSKFGLSLDSSNGALTYNGEFVRYFCDGVDLGGGQGDFRYGYYSQIGTVDVFTKRDVIDIGNGDIDPFGDLVGLEKSSQEEFDKRDFSERLSFYNVDFSTIFSRYNSFGLTYESDHENENAYYHGNVYFNGELVKTFIDRKPGAEVFLFTSKDGGSMAVQTVYDNGGKLTAIEIIK